MGTCESCAYFHTTDNILFNKYVCSLYNRYVKKSDTCENFTAKPSGGTCFLTGACVNYMGKEDDCEELTLLRNFRDNYMRPTKEGNALVDEYYKVAPLIVEKIESSGDKDKHYRYIYSVVQKCVLLIKQEKNEEALTEYRNMVLTLKKQFI